MSISIDCVVVIIATAVVTLAVCIIAILIVMNIMSRHREEGYEELAEAWHIQVAINSKRLEACEKQLAVYQEAIEAVLQTPMNADTKSQFWKLKIALDEATRLDDDEKQVENSLINSTLGKEKPKNDN